MHLLPSFYSLTDLFGAYPFQCSTYYHTTPHFPIHSTPLHPLWLTHIFTFHYYFQPHPLPILHYLLHIHFPLLLPTPPSTYPPLPTLTYFSLIVLFLCVLPYSYTRPGTSLCALLVMFYLIFRLHTLSIPHRTTHYLYSKSTMVTRASNFHLSSSPLCALWTYTRGLLMVT